MINYIGLKMDSSKYFTITLTSSDTSFDSNNIAEFRTILPKEKILKGNWVVGITEIHYTKSWFNINTEQVISLLDSDGHVYISPRKLSAGFYHSEKELTEEITKCTDACRVIIEEENIVLLRNGSRKNKSNPNIVLPKLEFCVRSRRVSKIVGSVDKNKLYLILSDELNQMFGISNASYMYDTPQYEEDEYYSSEDIDQQPKKPKIRIDFLSDVIKGNEESFRCYDLNSGIHSLFVYCNLIDPVLVGNSFAPLLRTVPIQNKKYGDQCHQIYTKPYFYPVSSSNFQVIKTSICDKTGTLIPFKFGETTIVLEFRKR